ncbi:uncharacterized protein JN550_013056 [Neoarthrinium moseri]|uniref:uncharacterized protein n=1 Tax=Neoarthrinium moseri TaxID=1658444 RepID=UPI001FDD1255|nr:uncharacterized protein JN550_013056 [Neoarthrinium moseri]KAI1857793.1 hypothetical protein JN550_013056 [Neoarthrinium moseri]
MRLRTWLCCPLAAASLTLAAVEPSAGSDFRPSKELARRRGPEIFNAVHNAMRQWGSSLHHNGMSFFLATVPQGVLLHHGSSSPDPPSQPDWLAYEIEHAENFARGRRGPGGPPGRGPPGDGPDGGPQEVMGSPWHGTEMVDGAEVHGYLHVYETTRPLKFLYIDGMGAGKTSMGTLDSQDYLLRGKSPENGTDSTPRPRRRPDGQPPERPRGGGPMDEQQRARDLCQLCKEWDLQGVVRMEAGFEIIKCDFSDGLREVQVLQRPDEILGRPGGFGNLEYFRGVSERYNGIGSSRTAIDYSSMVSAFFFPVNLTNPNPKRQDLPRLRSAEQPQLAEIKSYLESVIHARRDHASRVIDWQDVSDLIVSRYADRVKYMAEAVQDIGAMAREVNFLLTLFVDGSDKGDSLELGISRCSNFYLRSVSPVTEADVLIRTAFETVTREICTTLFRVRSLVVTDPAPDQSSLAASVSVLRALMQSLNWARFKRCPPCAIDEVCVIPMWPMGTVEEYNNPQCSNGTETGERYWDGGPGRPPGDRRPGDGDAPPPSEL